MSEAINIQSEPVTLEVCQGQEEVYLIAKTIEYSKKQIMENSHVQAVSHYD